MCIRSHGVGLVVTFGPLVVSLRSTYSSCKCMELELRLCLVSNPILMRQNFCFLLDTGRGKLTVGKLYGGILIHENWRNTKFGQIEELRKQEAELEALERAEALAAAEAAAKEVADRGSSFEAEQEAEERKKLMEEEEQQAGQAQTEDNYMNEADFFDARQRQQM